MKKLFLSFAILPIFLLAAHHAQADVDVRLGFGGYRRGGYGYGSRYRGYYGGPSVVVAPGYVNPYYYPYYAQPVYVQPGQVVYPPTQAPVAQQSAPTPTDNSQNGTGITLSGDYATDLATLHGKLAKSRNLLKRQKTNGGISQERYDQYMNQLEAIEKDEHERSYNNNGQLNDQDFAELIGRTDEVWQGITEALAE